MASTGTTSFGRRTGSSKMPDTGRASYVGGSKGALVIDGTLPVRTRSRMQIDVDFRSESIQISSTNTRSGETRLPLDFAGSGRISGAAFSGTVSGGQVLGNIDGETTGRFYGPNAEEVGGTFSLNGRFGGATRNYVGSFGAKR